jgi:Iap family predicted aminopeptidase
VVFAFWSGEELGLLGSSDFLEEDLLSPDRILAYVNLDMVGRMKDNRLVVQATGTSPVWPRLIEQANVVLGFDVRTSEDPYLPTDVMSFNQAGVPSINLFTGGHEDYHRPTDTASRIDYPDLERVARFGILLVEKLMKLEERPAFVRVERPTEAGPGRASLRAFTGTIPDYTTDVEGLKLSGVIEGGPAAEAGLREGDVIVEFAGQTITNIYDYTYALDAVKIGEPVEVVYVRDGERREATMTPRARK